MLSWTSWLLPAALGVRPGGTEDSPDYASMYFPPVHRNPNQLCWLSAGLGQRQGGVNMVGRLLPLARMKKIKKLMMTTMMTMMLMVVVMVMLIVMMNVFLVYDGDGCFLGVTYIASSRTCRGSGWSSSSAQQGARPCDHQIVGKWELAVCHAECALRITPLHKVDWGCTSHQIPSGFDANSSCGSYHGGHLLDRCVARQQHDSWLWYGSRVGHGWLQIMIGCKTSRHSGGKLQHGQQVFACQEFRSSEAAVLWHVCTWICNLLIFTAYISLYVCLFPINQTDQWNCILHGCSPALGMLSSSFPKVARCDAIKELAACSTSRAVQLDAKGRVLVSCKKIERGAHRVA